MIEEIEIVMKTNSWTARNSLTAIAKCFVLYLAILWHCSFNFVICFIISLAFVKFFITKLDLVVDSVYFVVHDIIYFSIPIQGNARKLDEFLNIYN